MASCITPLTIKDKKNDSIGVPCGRCAECYKRRVSGWSFRLLQEDKVSVRADFITFTYDSSNLHFTPNGFMNLDKRDVQLFFKKLRKLNANKIKYYLCGEYGGKTNRPHYHAIIFNADINTYQAAWDKGQIHYGTVSGASVGYTLKYMCKPARIPMHQRDDRQKEFSLMSKSWVRPISLNRIYDGIRQLSLTDSILKSRTVKKYLCRVTTRKKSITNNNARQLALLCAIKWRPN